MWYISMAVMKVTPCILVLFSFQVITSGRESSKVVGRPGHYPYTWCQISNVVWDLYAQAFTINQLTELDVASICPFVTNIWPIKSLDEDKNQQKCDKEYDEGHVFTIYYWGSSSNYFHLHYDMMIPLYQTLYYQVEDPPENVALLPSVETSRLQKMNWDTDAFDHPSRYWMQLMKLLLSDGTAMLPLNRTFLNRSSNICFKELYFGTPKYNIDNAEFIQSFAKHVRDRLFVLERPLTLDNLRVGLITRSNRRRILNEGELIDSIRPFIDVELVRFEGLKVREQIALMQKFSIIIGMNGAGLTNAIFRSEHSVAIQLVPYQAQLNHETFGKLLSATGPYMIWHNKHSKNHHKIGQDSYSNGDTVVHVEEFKQIVLNALSIVKDGILGIKEEL